MSKEIGYRNVLRSDRTSGSIAVETEENHVIFEDRDGKFILLDGERQPIIYSSWHGLHYEVIHDD